VLGLDGSCSASRGQRPPSFFLLEVKYVLVVGGGDRAQTYYSPPTPPPILSESLPVFSDEKIGTIIAVHGNLNEGWRSSIFAVLRFGYFLSCDRIIGAENE
jgi:hypothetical protein